MKKILATVLVFVLLAVPMIASAQIDLVNELININIYKAASTPVIDGKLDAEAYKKIDTTINDFLVYGGDGDYDAWMSANLPEAYISYDANNIYILLIGTAEKYYYCDKDGDSSGDVWQQSCMQVSLGQNNKIASGGERLEIGMGRNHATGEQVNQVWSQGSDSYGKDDLELVTGKNAAVLLEGGKLSYEVAIPWTTFLPAAPKAGDVFGFNFIYGWSDDGSRFGVEFANGCCVGKNADLFAQVTVVDELTYVAPPVVEVVEEAPAAAAVEEAAPAAPAAPVAPRVGDAGMITLAVVMMIAAAGVVILRKKVTVK